MTVLDAFDLAVCDDAELGRRVAAGDAQARRELIERYVPLARWLALRPRRPGEGAGRPDPGRLARPPQGRRALASGDGVRVLRVRRADDPRRARPYFRDATWIVRPPRSLIKLSRLVEIERQKFGAVLGPEQAQIRHVADTLLFCADLPNDVSARA